MITAILNVYRRPKNLKEQVEAIFRQTVAVEDIFIWKNEHPANSTLDLSDFPCKVFNCNYNWKYAGRFAGACLSRSKFTAVFDDDTIPGPKWFENCLQTYETHPGIIGGAGVNLHYKHLYSPNDRYGWSSQNENVVQVDLVGHAWFFPTEYISYFWRQQPMWDNAEDIHFSAMCQIHGGINTYVAPHPDNDRDLWSSVKGKELGTINPSSQDHIPTFYSQRNEYVQKMVKAGWKTQLDLT